MWLLVHLVATWLKVRGLRNGCAITLFAYTNTLSFCPSRYITGYQQKKLMGLKLQWSSILSIVGVAILFMSWFYIHLKKLEYASTMWARKNWSIPQPCGPEIFFAICHVILEYQVHPIIFDWCSFQRSKCLQLLRIWNNHVQSVKLPFSVLA